MANESPSLDLNACVELFHNRWKPSRKRKEYLTELIFKDLMNNTYCSIIGCTPCYMAEKWEEGFSFVGFFFP